MASIPSYSHLLRTSSALRKAVRKADSLEEIKKIIGNWSGKLDKLFPILAEHSRFFDKEVVVAILSGGTGSAALVENEHRGDEWEEFILRWSANRIIGEAKTDSIKQAALAATKITRKGSIPFSNQAYGDLQELAEEPDHLKPRHHAALAVLLSHPNIDLDALEKLKEKAQMPEAKLALIRNPRVDSSEKADWMEEALLRVRYNIRLFNSLLQDRDSRQIDFLRPYFLRALGKPEMLMAFGEGKKATGWNLILDWKKDSVQGLALAMTVNPEAANTFINKYWKNIKENLKGEMLEQALAAPSRDVRAATLDLIGRFSDGET